MRVGLSQDPFECAQRLWQPSEPWKRVLFKVALHQGWGTSPTEKYCKCYGILPAMSVMFGGVVLLQLHCEPLALS